MLAHTSGKEAWAFYDYWSEIEKHERLKNKTSKKTLLIIYFLPEDEGVL